MRSFLVLLATFFGVGRLPKIPGTWGTLATVPFAIALARWGPLSHMIVTFLLLPVSMISAQVYMQEKGGHDPKEVVIDEVVGYLIACTWLPFTWQSFLASFVLFRFFDMVKPWPISVLDRRIKGGVGVVIDDVAAGIIVNILLQLVVSKTMWLGVQAIIVQTGPTS